MIGKRAREHASVFATDPHTLARDELRSTARAAATYALHRQVLVRICGSEKSARSSFRVNASVSVIGRETPALDEARASR